MKVNIYVKDILFHSFNKISVLISCSPERFSNLKAECTMDKVGYELRPPWIQQPYIMVEANSNLYG